ncbi:MAG TPA: CBS domain-containing protein [Microlunatus sp.]|nr:CBS domain-containing protein [Microlunatus sp.]
MPCTPVSDVMLRHPKVLDAQATVDEARAALTDDHVHMALLTEGSTLVGTLVRTDLPHPIQRSDQGSGPALPWSTLRDRTVPSATSADTVNKLLIERGLRRLAVIDHDGTLLGLMCLKRSRTGFCSDEDVASRAQSRALSRQAAD